MPKGGKLCAVKGCSNREMDKNKSVSFHKFPFTWGPEYVKAWENRLRRKNFRATRHMVVCSEHFESSCFEYQNFTGRRQLKIGSEPTIFKTFEKEHQLLDCPAPDHVSQLEGGNQEKSSPGKAQELRSKDGISVLGESEPVPAQSQIKKEPGLEMTCEDEQLRKVSPGYDEDLDGALRVSFPDSEVSHNTGDSCTTPEAKRHTPDYSRHTRHMSPKNLQNLSKSSLPSKGVFSHRFSKQNLAAPSGGSQSDQKKGVSTPTNKGVDVNLNKCSLKAQAIFKEFEMPIVSQSQVANPFPCIVCSKSCANIDELNRHLSEHTLVKLYRCQTCRKLYQSSSQLAVHQLVHAKLLKCNVCSREFPNKQEMSRHRKHAQILKKNVTNQKLPCSVCNEVFSDLQRLREHTVKHPEGCLCVCDVCGKDCVDRQSLWCHKYRHVSNTYQCEVCGQMFKEKHYLQSHALIKHKGIKPFKCNTCGKELASKDGLKGHLLMHKGPGPFKCEVCGKAYYSAVNLSNHQNSKHKCPQ